MHLGLSLFLNKSFIPTSRPYFKLIDNALLIATLFDGMEKPSSEVLLLQGGAVVARW